MNTKRLYPKQKGIKKKYKRVPEEDETDERKVVLQLLKKSFHVPPLACGRAKHWSSNSEDSYMRVEMTNIGSLPTIHSHPR